MEPGTILQERYRIKKQIGQGGMGTVFVGTDERFGSTVAIKETFFEDEKLSKAFVREARLLNGLKHPALPKVSDYFNENQSQYIVMEFIAGDDLSETMEKSLEPFPVQAVLNWGDQLCNALEYLHTQEMPVIHRDIKPQNLKLTPEGQIILLDFGLAKGNPNDASHKTAAKSIFGYSRNYASLEQIQGTGTDPQSDLYSLAATLYHLLTGIPPADALTRAMNVLNGQPDPLIPANFVNRKIPPGVAGVLQKTMALNAGERPATAVAMRALLLDCDKTVPDGIDLDSAGYLGTDLLNQETRLMAATTNVLHESEASKNTGLIVPKSTGSDSNSTLVIDENASQIDKDAPISAGSNRPRRRPLYLGAAAISGIFVISVMAFFMNNSVETGTSEPALKNQVISNVGVSSNKAPEEETILDPANSADSIVTDETTVPQVLAEQNPPETQTKTAEVPKSRGTSRETTVSSETAKGKPETYVIEGGDGKKIIIKGETMETDEYIMDESGIRLKNPGKPPLPQPEGKPVILTEELRGLTPKQREMLRNIRRLEEQRRRRLDSQGEKPPKPPPEKPEQP